MKLSEKEFEFRTLFLHVVYCRRVFSDQLRRKLDPKQCAVCSVSRDRASREGDGPGTEAVSGRLDARVRRLFDDESPSAPQSDVRMYGRGPGGDRGSRDGPERGLVLHGRGRLWLRSPLPQLHRRVGTHVCRLY